MTRPVTSRFRRTMSVLAIASTGVLVSGCGIFGAPTPQKGASLEDTVSDYVSVVADGDGDAAWEYLGPCRETLDKKAYEKFVATFAERVGAKEMGSLKTKRFGDGKDAHWETSWVYEPGGQKAEGVYWKRIDDTWRLAVC